jgi:hypothetical protein
MKKTFAILTLLAVQAGAYAITVADLKGDWTPNVEKSAAAGIASEKAKCENGRKMYKWDDKIVESRMKDAEKMIPQELQRRKMVMSFDDKRIGMLMGNNVQMADYTAAAGATAETLCLTVARPQNGQEIKSEITIAEGKYLTMKGKDSNDMDWIVWEKGDGKVSALDPKLVAPPTKDANGDLPEDVLKKVAKLAAAGDEAGAKAFYSAEYQEKWLNGKTLQQGWAYNKIIRTRVDGKMVVSDGEKELTGLKVLACRRMASTDGVYVAVGQFVSEDGKKQGPQFAPYFRQINGVWKIVAPDSFK